jgi:hypothetical protein
VHEGLGFPAGWKALEDGALEPIDLGLGAPVAEQHKGHGVTSITLVKSD